MAQILFDQEGLQTFDSYRRERLSKIPLDQLLIEPEREPMPSVSIRGDSKGKSKTSSKKESAEKSGDKSKRTSENEPNKSEESIKDTSRSLAKFDQQTLFQKKVEFSTPLTEQAKPPVIDLEKEWDSFNKTLNTEE